MMVAKARTLLLVSCLCLFLHSNSMAESSFDNRWSHVVVDGPGIAEEHCAVAIDGQGNPSIAYYDGANRALKFARLVNGTWQTETVDATTMVGKWTSLAIDVGGHPHIAYYNEMFGDLKYATHNGVAWSIQTVESDFDIGRYAAIATRGFNQPVIAYYNATHTDLKLAELNGTIWATQTVDSAGDVGSFASLAVDRVGNLHISYFDATNERAKYAQRVNGVWTLETLPTWGTALGRTSIALDTEGTPHVAFDDMFTSGPSSQKIAYVTKVGPNWTLNTSDPIPIGTTDTSVSLALDPSGTPNIVYSDGVGVHSAWYGTRLETAFMRGIGDPIHQSQSTSLAIDSFYTAHVAMVNAANGELAYMTQPMGTPPNNIDTQFNIPDLSSQVPDERFSSAGDFNNDGLDDILIGASFASPEGRTQAGQIHLFLGRPNRVATLNASDADVTWDGLTAFDHAGDQVAPAGDVNNDGFDDILISVPKADPNGFTDAGQVFLVYGNANPAAGITAVTINGTATTTVFDMAPAGDVNGDGFDDVLIQSRASGPPVVLSTHVLYGSGSLPAVMDIDQIDVTLATTGVLSPVPGDVNNDGFDDILITRRGIGGITGIYYSGPSLPTGRTQADADVTISGDIWTASFVGDINGDSFDDFSVGQTDKRVVVDGITSVGETDVFYGGPSLPATTSAANADVRILATQYGFLGFYIEGGRDFNGDGLADLLIAAPSDGPRDDSQGVLGAVYILFGSPSLPSVMTSAEMDVRILGPHARDTIGDLMAFAGDFDGDGFDDVLSGIGHDGLPTVYLTYGPRHDYTLSRFDGEVFEPTSTHDDAPGLLNPTVATPVHFGSANAADILFAINGKNESYYYFDNTAAQTYTLLPTTLTQIPGSGPLENLWADAVPRVPDFLLGWDPDGDGNDEVWAFVGSDFYVFDWNAQQFGAAQPLSTIGAAGLAFQTVTHHDSGGGLENLVAFDGSTAFLYNPTTLSGGMTAPLSSFTADGSSFAPEFTLATDGDLNGQNEMHVIDLDTNALWTYNESTGKLDKNAAPFSQLWPRGVVALDATQGDFLFAFKPAPIAVPQQFYSVLHR